MNNLIALRCIYLFDDVFVKQINTFQECLTSKALASFYNIEEDANRLAEDEFKQLGERPAGPDDFTDPADLAESARDTAIEYYITMSNMKYVLIGLFTAGLYHLFEQQIFHFYNKIILDFREPKAIISKKGWSRFKTILKDLEGIDLDTFDSHMKLEPLRLSANVIKHAEGWSAERLKELKPDYFMPEGNIFPSTFPDNVDIKVDFPLTGEDIRIPLDDFNQYCEDVRDFWKKFGRELIRE